MILYDTKFLQLKSTKSKSHHDWYYAHRPNATNVVVIVPIIQDKILFLKEERPPLLAENIGKFSVGLPAGLVGDERTGETIEQAINAELLEETGLVANNIEIKSAQVASSAGCLSETFTIAFAYIDEYITIKEPIDDGGIITDRILVKKQDIFTWLHAQEKQGGILTSQALSALLYLYEKEKL